jgi:hypothetical protein
MAHHRKGRSIDTFTLEPTSMSTIHHKLAAVLFASLALAASVQAQQPMDASSPMAGNMKAGDCAKPAGRHDHGAEKGTPRSQHKSAPCMANGASAPAAAAPSAKRKPAHDHGKTHKTM